MKCDDWHYKHEPISSVESLANALGVNKAHLLNIAENVERHYLPGKRIKKSDGSYRYTHNAKGELKDIHHRIKSRLLGKMDYPAYLTGSLPNSTDVIRGTRGNARAHLGSNTLISEDIENFFPSITKDAVLDIWKYLFGFSPEVSTLLTTLTTHNGSVPQGWAPSSYIANMALWRAEPDLYQWCLKRRLRYTRYVDDINVSSRQPISAKLTNALIQQIHSTLARCGFRMKRSKHVISRPGRRKSTVGKNVDRRRPTIPSTVRSKIRAAVHQCEVLLENEDYENLKAKIPSVKGRIAYLKELHPEEAQKLFNKLSIVEHKV